MYFHVVLHTCTCIVNARSCSFVHVCIHVCIYMYVVIETRQSKATMPIDKLPQAGVDDVPCTRQMLYQVNHQGNSAGQAESLNVIQG